MTKTNLYAFLFALMGAFLLGVMILIMVSIVSCIPVEPESPVCVSETSYCEYSQLKYCYNGKWITNDCLYGCSEGRCLLCKPGTSRCVGDQVEFCVDGKYTKAFSCEYGCTFGVSSNVDAFCAPTCRPYHKECGLLTCDHCVGLEEDYSTTCPYCVEYYTTWICRKQGDYYQPTTEYCY